jgi:hypothetical protein
MRAVALAMMLAVSAQAEAGEDSRFEVRSTRIHGGPAGNEAGSSGRFSVQARVRSVDPVVDPGARFHARTTLESAGSSCGPLGELVFRDGFE